MAPLPGTSTPSPEPLLTLAGSLLISHLCYKLTASLIPRLSDDLLRKGLGGADLLKGPSPSKKKSISQNGEFKEDGKEQKGKPLLLPEATGMIGAAVYVLLLTAFAPLPYYTHFLPSPAASSTTTSYPDDLLASPSGLADAGVAFPHHSLSTYLASLLSLLIATFLGFLDDLFDIRWRYKLPIPIIASVPLLVVYFAGHGVTDVVLPKVLGIRSLFGVEQVSGVLKLGPLYYIYMSMLSTFCTNSINILAGINGVEVGQALVIALSIALNDLLYIKFDLKAGVSALSDIFSVVSSGSMAAASEKSQYLMGFGLARGSQELEDRHLFSLYFMLPLVGVCFGLLKHNWYPARAFIGDTFCYFSGMAFAVVGILGHFSKTVLLFFIPQIFNFLFSCPQLFGIVPCPRHRLPRFDPKTGLLFPSTATFTVPPTALAKAILKLCAAFSLVKLTYASDGKTILTTTNFTIINMILCLFGPMKEPNLTKAVMLVQVGGSVLAFVVRYAGAGLFYDKSRR